VINIKQSHEAVLSPLNYITYDHSLPGRRCSKVM